MPTQRQLLHSAEPWESSKLSHGRTDEEVMHGGCSATCVSTSEVHKEPLESSDLPWVELLSTHDDDVDVQLLTTRFLVLVVTPNITNFVFALRVYCSRALPP
jgi:hypothetical protein